MKWPTLTWPIFGRPGSTLWLLSCELRLSWRGLVGGRRGRWRLGAMAVLAVIFTLIGFPVAWMLRGFEAPVNGATCLAADIAALMIVSLMLSQTLAGATDALYTRGDLDLLFSSPLDPRKTLTVRFAALAASAFMAFALLVSPLLIPLAIFGHWRWLAVLPVLAALAMTASGVGLALAVGLFALIGPRRTRAVAQVLAAIIGAGFFLVSQAQTLLGAKGGSVVMRVMDAAAAHPDLQLPPLADWPLRAALGDPVPLAAMLAVGLTLFLGVAAWLSRRFALDATAAQGADVGQRKTGPTLTSFAGGAFAVTYLKEFRVLRRDVGLLAQVLLRTLYLLPATFLVLRNAGHHASLALPGGAAVIAFLAGQVASSLTWITLSAEEVPELIAAAPASAASVRYAKLLAGLTPLIVMLAIPLGVLIWLSPAAGLAATAGSAASAIAAGLINAWHPNPGKRSEFRRRRTGSLLTGIALMLVTLLIAAATGLATIASPFAVAPAVMAALGLLALRRSPTQIADRLAASA
jgi:ABC-2 type transport system permease protein